MSPYEIRKRALELAVETVILGEAAADLLKRAAAFEAFILYGEKQGNGEKS